MLSFYSSSSSSSCVTLRLPTPSGQRLISLVTEVIEVTVVTVVTVVIAATVVTKRSFFRKMFMTISFPNHKSLVAEIYREGSPPSNCFMLCGTYHVSSTKYTIRLQLGSRRAYLLKGSMFSIHGIKETSPTKKYTKHI